MRDRELVPRYFAGMAKVRVRVACCRPPANYHLSFYGESRSRQYCTRMPCSALLRNAQPSAWRVRRWEMPLVEDEARRAAAAQTERGTPRVFRSAQRRRRLARSVLLPALCCRAGFVGVLRHARYAARNAREGCGVRANQLRYVIIYPLSALTSCRRRRAGVHMPRSPLYVRTRCAVRLQRMVPEFSHAALRV